MPSITTRRTAIVNFATAANQPLVAAQGGRNKIKVVSFLLVAAGAVVVTFQTAATPITGPMTMATGIPLTADPGDVLARLFETNPNEALNLLLSGAVQVSGFVNYVVEP
jgi:hypothetical protein